MYFYRGIRRQDQQAGSKAPAIHPDPSLRPKLGTWLNALLPFGFTKVVRSMTYLPQLWHRTRRSCPPAHFARAPRRRILVFPYESKHRNRGHRQRWGCRNLMQTRAAGNGTDESSCVERMVQRNAVEIQPRPDTTVLSGAELSLEAGFGK